MPEFDALGRDVAAAADSTFDNPVALAVKQLWTWAGFDQGTNPNHLWTVSADAVEDGFSVTAVVKDADVYVPEVTPAPPASAEEIARSNADAEPPVDEPAVSEVAPTPEPEVVAEDTPAAEAAPEPVEAVPADPPVAASSSESSTPSDSTTDAAAS